MNLYRTRYGKVGFTRPANPGHLDQRKKSPPPRTIDDLKNAFATQFSKTDQTQTTELKGVDLTDARPRKQPRASLIVYGDDQPPELHILCGKERKRLGRGEQMDITVNDIEVSRCHAEFILFSDGKLSVEDMNSHNGTRVNGEWTVLTYLYRGDVVQMGSVRALVDIADQPAEPIHPPAEDSIAGTPEVVVAFDLRIVAAIHCRVEAIVEEGAFRRDLLYQLNTFTLELRPLRKRPEEIKPLAELFLAQACGGKVG